MKQLGKRGNADMVVSAIVALGVGVITIAVIAIMLGAFRDDVECQTGYTFNSTASNCYLTTNASVKDGTTIEYNVTGRGLTFLDNATSKFGTAGTIVGVLFLLAVIGGGGVLGVMAYRKVKG
jgi:hypothetical protein